MPIKFHQVSHIYSEGTPFKYAALTDVNLDIEEGRITAIIGKTGSGKSTLVQHLNALLLPSSGEIEILDRTIKSSETPKNLKSLRKNVGLVFQFPEYQLFEETIIKDVSFGPKNFGIEEDEAIAKAKDALKLVGLDESYYEKSPLDLSGGQKRRVAIAGILVMDPQVIVLDEPTAGLDPQGAKDMMQLFKDLNTKHHKTILMVTHDMEHVINYCDNVVVMDNGQVRLTSSVQSFFEDSHLCRQLGILPPAVIRVKDELNTKGFNIDKAVVDLDSLVKAIAKEVKSHE